MILPTKRGAVLMSMVRAMRRAGDKRPIRSLLATASERLRDAQIAMQFGI